MKKDGMDIKQIAEKLNVKREDIRAEMMKLVKSIKEQKQIKMLKRKRLSPLFLFFMNFQFLSINSRLSQKLTQVNDVS